MGDQQNRKPPTQNRALTEALFPQPVRPHGAMPLPQGPRNWEDEVMDFGRGVFGFGDVVDPRNNSEAVGSMINTVFNAPVAGVSVFAKGLKGGLNAINEIKMMHNLQATQSMDDLDKALDVMGLLGHVSRGQKARMLEIAGQYPSTMAHLIERTRADGVVNPRVGVYGEIGTQLGGVAGMAPDIKNPGRSTMGFSPNPKKLGDPVNTFAEELAHTAQMIGLKEHAGPLYQAVKQAGVPYERNPFEVNAKITAAKLAPTMMQRVQNLLGIGPRQQQQVPLLQQLQDLDILPRSIQPGGMMEYLRQQGVPAGTPDIGDWAAAWPNMTLAEIKAKLGIK